MKPLLYPADHVKLLLKPLPHQLYYVKLEPHPPHVSLCECKGNMALHGSILSSSIYENLLRTFCQQGP